VVATAVVVAAAAVVAVAAAAVTLVVAAAAARALAKALRLISLQFYAVTSPVAPAIS